MLQKRWLLVILSLLLLALPTAAQDNTPFHLNIVIRMTGSAWIHRAEWDDLTFYEPLILGAFVGNADIIEPDPGIQVFIQCANGQVVVIANTGASPSLCTPLLPYEIARGLLPSSDRGAESDMVRLVYPVGLIAEDRPQIRWRGLSYADAYRVTITSGGDEVWERTYRVEDTFLDYPDDEDELEPGEYNVVIEALRSNNRPIEERGANESLVFDPDLVKAVEDEWEKRDFSDAQEGMSEYLHALLLADAGYMWDAINILEAVLAVDAETGVMLADPPPSSLTLQGSPAPYLNLGAWYSTLELNDYAVLAYEAALMLAQSAGQRESEAVAVAALGRLNPPEMNDSASEYYCNLRRAVDFFALFEGDNDIVVSLRNQMTAIEEAAGDAYDC